jgi:hypothetical protein
MEGKEWSGIAMSTLRHAAFPDHDRKMKNWKDE